MKNKCLNILRQQKHFSDTTLDDLEELLCGDGPTVELEVITKMEFERMRYHLNQLDAVSRQVLEMHYALKLSVKEIATELGMEEKAVEMRIYRAKKKVRKSMGEE